MRYLFSLIQVIRPGRTRSIRTLLAVLFLVPLASLLALWGFAASVTLGNALQEHNFTNQDRLYGAQAQNLGTALALERSASFVWLSSGRRAPTGPLIAQWRFTDANAAAFKNGVNANPGIIVPSARPALLSFLSALGRLGSIRAAIESGRVGALTAFASYNSVIDAQFRLYDQLIVVSDISLYRQEAASLEAGRALELIDREVTLVNGAMAAGGQMSKAERILFAQIVATQRQLFADAMGKLDPGLSAGYQSVYTSPAYHSFAAIENRIIAGVGSTKPIAMSQATWTMTSFSLLSGFAKGEGLDRTGLASRGTQVGDRLLLEVLLAGGVGLVAVSLFIYLMARFGRRISRELTGLQRSAIELATQRLPQVISRLSRGEEVDPRTEADLPPAGRIAEITRVAQAFSSVQRTAVEAAAGQARLRQGVSQVFRNLAWRSQALLHRQLALLDAMERRSAEPETLEELFQLDHLTTRMRRHAEGLIILSGAPPGRGWHEPVPLVDVLRAAVAEVEDYTRVSVVARSDDAVTGGAVADMIHLIAELIENAATNSPANTEVTVRAERVAHGIVVEIEDRGLGMSAEEFAAANQRLAISPEFDLADSDKLGFFVVARLAARHHLKITLRPSPYGGVTAIVLLSHGITIPRENVAVDGHEPLPLPAAAGLADGVLPSGPATDYATPDVLAEQDRWHVPAPVSAWPADSPLVTGPNGSDPEHDRLPWVAQSDPDSANLSGYPELPQRVREASLHPELKASPPPSVPGPPQEVTQERTPVENGALFASLQQGWQRGRSEAEQTDTGADG